MGFFNNLFNIEKAPTVNKTVSAPYVPPYPLEKDFYTFDKVEWSVTTSFNDTFFCTSLFRLVRI